MEPVASVDQSFSATKSTSIQRQSCVWSSVTRSWPITVTAAEIPTTAKISAAAKIPTAISGRSPLVKLQELRIVPIAGHTKKDSTVPTLVKEGVPSTDNNNSRRRDPRDKEDILMSARNNNSKHARVSHHRLQHLLLGDSQHPRSRLRNHLRHLQYLQHLQHPDPVPSLMRHRPPQNRHPLNLLPRRRSAQSL